MPNGAQWAAAIASELQSLRENETFEVVHKSTLPPGAKVLAYRWVFAVL
jgi:hypothetical protein